MSQQCGTLCFLNEMSQQCGTLCGTLCFFKCPNSVVLYVFLNVPTVWYPNNVVLYVFLNVPTVWYFMFFEMSQQCGTLCFLKCPNGVVLYVFHLIN